jgi:hypothetical protein
MDLNTLREYLNIHLISLQQDLDKHRPEDTLLVEYLEGAIDTVLHILGVMDER